MRHHAFIRRLGLVALYGLIAAWSLRPVSLRPVDTVAGMRRENVFAWGTLGDVYLTMWVLASGAQQLVADPANVFHAHAFYPDRYALALAEHLLGHQPLFAPFYALSGNPVLALNCSTLLSTTLLGLGTHLLIRRWGGDLAAALLGAVLVVCAPWRVGWAAVRVHMLWVHYLPFILLFFERYLERRRARDLVLGSACLVLQVLTSYYTGYAALLALAVVLLYRLRAHFVAVVHVALSLVLVAGVCAVVSYPYLILARGGVIGSGAGMAEWGTLLGAPGVLTRSTVGLVPLAGTVLLLLLRRVRGVEGAGPPCGALVAIAAVGYVLALGPTVEVPRAPQDALKLAWNLLTVTMPGALGRRLAEIGSEVYRIPLPWELLAATVPGFDKLRAASRFGLLPAFALPVAAAFGFRRLGTLLPACPGLLAVCLSLLVLYRVPPVFTHHVEVRGALPPAYVWLQNHGRGRPLLELPRSRNLGIAGIYSETRAMYFATYHRLPLLNGYSTYVRSTFRRREELMAQLPLAKALDELCAEVGPFWILLHRDRASRAGRLLWAKHAPAFRVAACFGNDVVFETSCPGGDPRLRGTAAWRRETAAATASPARPSRLLKNASASRTGAGAQGTPERRLCGRARNIGRKTAAFGAAAAKASGGPLRPGTRPRTPPLCFSASC